MMEQSDNALSDRGGIPVRDYTLGSAGMRSAGGGVSGAKNILQKFNFDKLARRLVWVSLGLGLMEVLMPRRVQKLAGVRRGNYTWLIRIAGLREITHALLIVMQPRPSQGVWSRVAGDAMDLGLLGAAFTKPRVERNRLAAVTASIVGITALDALTATQVTRKRSEAKRYSVMTQADLSGRSPDGGFRVMRSITINRPPEELYAFWRNFANLPRFMYHLQSVQVMGDRRSHWITTAPAGRQVEWDAEITEDRPNELIAWQSTANADVPNSGMVRFEPRQGGRGTVVRVEMDYRPPAGAIGKIVAALFGKEPGQQVKGDLGRFKQVMETGEVIRSDASPAGLGQKVQHPGQPVRSAEPQRNKTWDKYGHPERGQVTERQNMG